MRRPPMHASGALRRSIASGECQLAVAAGAAAAAAGAAAALRRPPRRAADLAAPAAFGARLAVARLAVVRWAAALRPRTAVPARRAALRTPASRRATVFSSPASRFSSSLMGNAFTRLWTAFTRSPPAAGARRRAVVLTRLTVRLTAVGTPPLLRLV